MFSSLAPNNTVYILDKTDGLSYIEGRVHEISQARSKTGTLYGQPNDMVVDIKIDMNGTINSFTVPANFGIVSDRNYVVSDTKELLETELENTYNTSLQIKNSIEYHDRIINSYPEIKKILSPKFAREQEREQKIDMLEKRIGGMENTMTDIKDMMTRMFNNKN